MLHSITDMLSTSSYVIVLALDFSKVFDTVRHYTLLQKIGLLDIPDSVYNWSVNFFSERRHSTRYGGDISTMLEINASIIQGSALGSVSYVVNAGDLNTVTPGNRIHKYADDTWPTSLYQPVTLSVVLPNLTTLKNGHRSTTWNLTEQSLRKSSSPVNVA